MTNPPSLPNAPWFVHAELRPFGEDATLIITPTGEMYQVDATPAVVEQVLQQCDGLHPLDEIIASTPNPDEFADILSVLIDENCLSYQKVEPDQIDWSRFPKGSVTPDRLKQTRILLLGDERLTQQVQARGFLGRFLSAHLTARADLPNMLAQYPTADTLVLALRETLDTEFLLWLDETCQAANVRWTQFHLEQGIGWLGPAIVPGYTANYHDLLTRRLTAAEDPQQHNITTGTPTLAGQPYLPPTHELIWMLSTLFIEIERWVAAAPCGLLSVEIEANPLQMALKPYPLLPLPAHRLKGPLQISAVLDANTLVNSRSGIVIRTAQVEHHPATPAALKTVQTHVANMSVYEPTWRNDCFSSGSAFGDVDAASPAALGEAIERYAANYNIGAAPLRASYLELVERGEFALDPESLTLFSKKMYNTPGCPFVPLRRDTSIYWVRGRSITRDCPAWLPASMVYVNWSVSGYKDSPNLHSAYFPGVASGKSLETALVSAIEELIERDITMIWWMNRQPLPAVILPAHLQAIWHGKPSELGQRYRAIYLPNEFDIPVFAGVVENQQEKFLNIGFACRPDPAQAILKAWAEAVTLQEGSRDIDDPNGLSRQSTEWGWLPASAFKPWRADRAYLNDFRADFRDVTHLMAQQQIFLDPRAIEQVRPWVDMPETLPFDSLPALPDRSFATYHERIEARGYEIFYADLTTADIACIGHKVVRAIIPGLTPNFPAAFPPVGNGRVQNIPVKLGWRNTPLAEEDLNYFPMPHA